MLYLFIYGRYFASFSSHLSNSYQCFEKVLIKEDIVKNLTIPNVSWVREVSETMVRSVESGVYEGYIT